MFSYGNSRSSLGKAEKRKKCIIISLALLELSKVSPQIVPLEVGMRPSAQITGGHGGGEEALGVHPVHPSKTLLKQEKTFKKPKIVSSQIVPQRGP